MDLAMVNSWEEWIDLYQKLLYWELELENIEDSGMFDILESQKAEANNDSVWPAALEQPVRQYARNDTCQR